MIEFSKKLKYLHNLKKINVSNNPICNEGIIALSNNLKYVSQLRLLHTESIFT